jgi:hypothetical protein
MNISSEQMPHLLATMDKPGRCVFVPEAYPHAQQLASAFEEMAAPYAEGQPDRSEAVRSHFQRLQNSLFRLESPLGGTVDCSLLYNSSNSTSSRLAIRFVGFSDEKPATEASAITDYVLGDHVGIPAKHKAQPNSWGPLELAGTTHDLLAADEETSMPVLTIFRPICPSRQNLQDIQQGNFGAYAGLVEAAVNAAESRLHGQAGTTRFNELNGIGLSLGATESLYALLEILRRQEAAFTIGTLALQELIIGPSNPLELVRFSQTAGKSPNNSTEGYIRIPEPPIRMLLDRAGNEWQMNLRMLAAVSRRQLLQGLAHPERTRDTVAELADRVPITIALAENSWASKDTRKHLAEVAGLAYITVSGVKEPLTHIMNEHHALCGIIADAGVRHTAAAGTR